VVTFECTLPPGDPPEPDWWRHTLLGRLRNEILDRFDALVAFRPIDYPVLCSIMQDAVARFCRQLRPHEITMRLHERVYQLIAAESRSTQCFAEELQPTLARLVLDPVREQIKAGTIQNGDSVDVFLREGRVVIRTGGAASPASLGACE
jgi:ATP-dependent Clp protease ATP-binding subunit ClpA